MPVQSTTRQAVILVTAPDLKTARRLARLALAERLVACTNLVPRVESHYWWNGQIESGAETLILFKTTRARLAALERLIVQHHPYTTPEFVVLSINSGSQRYLAWLTESVSAPKPSRSVKSRPAR